MKMDNGKIKQTFEQLKQKGKNKTALICTIMGAAGILMILLSSNTPGSTKKSDTVTLPDESTYNAGYIADLQANLTSIITQIDGVGSAEVLVTLESGVRYVYATENKTTGDRSTTEGQSASEKSTNETSIVVVDGENGKAPILLQRIEPVVMGVVVVCDGGGSVEVQQLVTDTVTTVCGVGANRVTVTKKSK